MLPEPTGRSRWSFWIPVGVVAAATVTLAACGDGKTTSMSTSNGSQGPSAGSISITISGSDSDSDGTDGTDSTVGTDGSTSGSSSNGSNSSNTGPKFDVGELTTTGFGSDSGDPCDTNGTEGCSCETPEHVPCDANTNDPFTAMGFNCPGEPFVTAVSMGAPTAIGVRNQFGQAGAWNPTEGSFYAVIGSGLVGELNNATPPGDSDAGPTYCNDDLGNYDPGGTLPNPIMINPVNGDCTQNMALVGTGDCSNTIQNQFDQGSSANDYTELRVLATVPDDVTSFSYDFAFFTTEWPFYANSMYNDMYIGWLTSELWTGNISFDGQGNPISLNAGFLNYQDAGGNLPEFAGTCMRQHAGTSWLSTSVGVTPGEQITIIFAIMDLSDSILDSYVFLDNFQWGCEPGGEPNTEPIG